jgi:phosphoglycerate dehydrogenase-like enzyme
MTMPTNTTVLLSPKVTESHGARLRERFGDVRFVTLGEDAAVPPEGTSATALLRVALSKGELSTALRSAPAVRWVHTSTAGFDWALVPEITERGITLTRSASSYAIAIGEFTLALITSWAKRLPLLATAQRERRWASVDPLELADLTIGVIGAGGIGHEVAWRCAALKMRVIGTKRAPAPRPHFDMIVGPQGLDDVLAEADVVVVACPSTPETRGLIDARALSRMRPGALLINVARGAVVVTDDLVEALAERRIDAAALDAFDQEPLPADHRLWGVPNLIVTPHTSFKSPHNLERVLGEFEDNLVRFVQGEPLRNALRDATLGY